MTSRDGRSGGREIVYRIGRRSGTIRMPERKTSDEFRRPTRSARLWRRAPAPGSSAVALAAAALPVVVLCAFLWLIRTLATA